MSYNFLILIFAPLIGFVFTGFIVLFENLYRVKVNSKIACLSVVLTTFFSTALALKIFYQAASLNFGFYWFNLKYNSWLLVKSELLGLDFLNLKWGFLFDSVSITMFLVITFVSVLVQLYATEYMSHDFNRTRFVGYLGLFVFFMIILVSSDNFIQLFIGWEGVGLVSYLLINFWYTRVEAARSALKAIGVNKFGDYALIMAVIFGFKLFGTADYEGIFSQIQYFNDSFFSVLTVEVPIPFFLGLFILIAAVGKSAQLGLHTWLPDAMEGPTPVSALIHAATMVTAGVYLLVRCSPILELSKSVLALTAIVGATTALFGASTAFFQNDLKKVIAYSTCSQLGYMVCACGLSAYSAAMFHLTTHAFFKALLFLCAGSVIHALADEQDMRKMGGLVKLLPFTYGMMSIGSFSLMGIPFLAGFFSKDLILETAASTYSFVGLYCFIAGCGAAIFTALYSVRLIFLTFLVKTNSLQSIVSQTHEAPILMSIPLVLLAILSIVGGWLLKPIFINSLTNEANFIFWKSSFLILSQNVISRVDMHTLSIFVKNLPTFLVSFSIISAGFIYSSKHYSNFFVHDFYLKNWVKKDFLQYEKQNNKKLFFPLGVYYFFNKKWYFDVLYNFYLVLNSYFISYKFVFKNIDRGLFNLFLAPYTVNSLNTLVKYMKRVQSGSLFEYVFLIIFSVSVILILIFINSF